MVNFLGALIHGPEISQITLGVFTPEEVQSAQLCGPDADACYEPSNQALIVPGNTPADGTNVADVIAHEYGHAIADHRTTSLPWPTVDSGAEDWASYENVCHRSLYDGTAFPGDEGQNYSLNPGEAFADSYRILNGGNTAYWQFDRSFYPDATALTQIKLDVTEPYARPQPLALQGSFRTGRSLWTKNLNTPFDGAVGMATSRSRGLRVAAQLYDPVTGVRLPVIAGKTMICGPTRIQLRVYRLNRKLGSFAVALSLP